MMEEAIKALKDFGPSALPAPHWQAMNLLLSQMANLRQVAELPKSGSKIGDTINIRKPQRFYDPGRQDPYGAHVVFQVFALKGGLRFNCEALSSTHWLCGACAGEDFYFDPLSSFHQRQRCECGATIVIEALGQPVSYASYYDFESDTFHFPPQFPKLPPVELEVRDGRLYSVNPIGAGHEILPPSLGDMRHLLVQSDRPTVHEFVSNGQSFMATVLNLKANSQLEINRAMPPIQTRLVNGVIELEAVERVRDLIEEHRIMASGAMSMQAYQQWKARREAQRSRAWDDATYRQYMAYQEELAQASIQPPQIGPRPKVSW